MKFFSWLLNSTGQKDRIDWVFSFEFVLWLVSKRAGEVKLRKCEMKIPWIQWRRSMGGLNLSTFFSKFPPLTYAFLIYFVYFVFFVLSITCEVLSWQSDIFYVQPARCFSDFHSSNINQSFVACIIFLFKIIGQSSIQVLCLDADQAKHLLYFHPHPFSTLHQILLLGNEQTPLSWQSCVLHRRKKKKEKWPTP